jgi:NAD(P)-dependent dehydrogenase (short-subunit alcohol dehydrogenase family)
MPLKNECIIVTGAAGNQAAYAASKAAVIRLIETIAAEHRADRITANSVLPGTIDTPVNRAAMPNAKPDIFVPPGAIAELIAYLVSPEAAVVTGAAIPAIRLV